LQAAAQSSLEAWRSDEARRLARERRVLEQQSKALLKLPSKKEKSNLEALEGQLEKERADARAAAARHRWGFAVCVRVEQCPAHHQACLLHLHELNCDMLY
jgi:hypothetical protein